MMLLGHFHNYTMVFLTGIMTVIFGFLLMKIVSKFTNTSLLSSRTLELIWTFVPVMILLLIAYPSLEYLYLMDLSVSPSLTLKVFGAQWYWIYEYGDFNNFMISSYMLKDQDIMGHQNSFMAGWRLLETDVRGILPFCTETRVLVTSNDVIHSFSMPGLGIKVDAVPGRLNWATLFNFAPGSVYGQCSEICGVGHSFMPIIIEFVPFKEFFNIMKSYVMMEQNF
uniref:cytochrome c oxidase subunit II n=1 Tax=Aeolothrips xinjiangensis TaxID=2942826 RepID=UPI0020281A15|nr:cytochrome c oxidase subunit II [Aeolothrips xinjiangensis]UQJ77468.1 cytochrome c oxidase subunit II [Aeolothrips xinjiangensis]